MTPDCARKLESSAQRPCVGDVLHPDDCAKMRIGGVWWSVRPLQLPEGIRYTPEFGDGVKFCQTVDPLGNKPMQDRAASLLDLVRGEPDAIGLFSMTCGYLCALLDQQYILSNEQKAELFSFRGNEPPPWLAYAIRHANGLPPMPTLIEERAMVEPEPPARPWWKLWGNN